MTKADLIAAITEQTGLEKAHVSDTVEAFFTVVKDSLAQGENIYVRGFGSFINKKRAKKVARNISQNTAIVIEEHYVPSFKPAKIFVEQVKSTTK
ncbi:MAG: HU family DNA-binding protein [Runella sp.]